MGILLLSGFLVVAAAAAGFAVWPLLNGARAPDRFLLAGSLAALVLGVGGGTYIALGRPALALRSLAGPSDTDIRSLVAVLATRVRGAPNDVRGWTLLGRGYLTLDDPGDAAAAFRRAVAVAAPAQRPLLLSAYGEALTLAASGAVSAEAEAAFAAALKLDPHDLAARYYLGQVYASRGDKAHAFFLWQGLLADMPPNAALHALLVDRIAALRAQSGSAPDIAAMVSGLAARLKAQPNDPEGWRRLVRAYAVLGQRNKAREALGNGRVALGQNRDGLAALNGEAEADGLDK